MKVSELSERSGVPLPTIKFYIREGLLPKGTSTAKNQADYGPEHLARLTLIRALKDDAGLGIEAIARALRAADQAKDEFIVAAIDALSAPGGTPVDPGSGEFDAALQAVLDNARGRKWNVTRKDVCVREAARALAVIARSFPEEIGSPLTPYFDAAELIARMEIPEDFAPDASREAALRYSVLGTMLFEPFILALRRMGHIAFTRLAEEARKPAKKGGKPRK
jgi:DNA-binding transcriptional MerR regulator